MRARQPDGLGDVRGDRRLDTASRTGRQGRPQAYADLAVETGLLLRLAFARPWRQTEGLQRSIVGLLGLELTVPDHITFSRRSINLRVVAALRQEGSVHIIIDPTGLKMFGTGEWQLEEHGGRARRSWRKLHLTVNPNSGGILASALTATDAGDASLVGLLLDQITGAIASVTADGAYDGDPATAPSLRAHRRPLSSSHHARRRCRARRPTRSATGTFI